MITLEKLGILDQQTHVTIIMGTPALVGYSKERELCIKNMTDFQINGKKRVRV